MSMDPEIKARRDANLARIKRMNLSEQERVMIVGGLAGCEGMEVVLDRIAGLREFSRRRRAAERGPIEGQTVIELPGETAAAPAA